jgi:hypothetical protein
VKTLLIFFLLLALCPCGSTATLEFQYPAYELTNGVCLWLEPLLNTELTTDVSVTVTITKLPATEGRLFLHAGADWVTNRLSDFAVADKPKTLRFDGSKVGKL